MTKKSVGQPTGTERRLIAITGDTHLGNRNVNFAPYFDPEHRQAYLDFEAMAKRAAEVMKERMVAGGMRELARGTGDVSMMMAAAAVGGLGNALIDIAGNGSVPYGPDYIDENTKVRKELFAQLGIDGWDDDVMTVWGEDDPDLRLKMLEADGQVGQVLFPQIGFLLSSLGPELKWAGIRAYNRWASEFASAHPDRYAACFMVELDDIPRACEEAQWAAEHNMRGGSYIGGGRPVMLPPFHDAYYAPYFSLLEELEMPFNMHAAFGGDVNTAGWQDGPGAAAINQMWLSYNNIAKGGPLYHWIFGEVFVRHPKLQIVIAETGGCYWAVDVLKALDEVYNAPALPISRIGKRELNSNVVARVRELPKSPSEFFRDNVTVQGHNSILDWEAVPKIPDSVLWSSDFPHPESSWPFSKSEIAENIAEVGLPFDQLQQFLAGNAARLYKFDLDKLQPVADEVGPVYAV
jgi:predicted TIM-barrel fold metal-dependent hydrolase